MKPISMNHTEETKYEDLTKIVLPKLVQIDKTGGCVRAIINISNV